MEELLDIFLVPRLRDLQQQTLKVSQRRHSLCNLQAQRAGPTCSFSSTLSQILTCLILISSSCFGFPAFAVYAICGSKHQQSVANVVGLWMCKLNPDCLRTSRRIKEGDGCKDCLPTAGC